MFPDRHLINICADDSSQSRAGCRGHAVSHLGTKLWMIGYGRRNSAQRATRQWNTLGYRLWKCPFRVRLRRTQCEQMSSGLPLKADIAVGMSQTCQRQKWFLLLYHLVRLGEECLRDGKTEICRCLAINDELKLRRRLNRQLR